jgi:NADPH:quinone reductase
MRAARCHRHGPPSVVRIDQVPDPAASAGQVVVDVEVASVNYPDVLLVAGGYQALPPLPFVVGAEFAGTISEVAADVAGFSVGDRVFGVSGLGAFAERIAVDARRLRHIPVGLDAASAAAFCITYETAYHSLRSVAHLQPGETVVVLGAAGGVGSAAVEVAVSLGARVIAAAGSPERLDFCATLGAHEVVDYQREDLKARLKQLAPAGVDVVLDPVGGPYSEPAMRAMSWGSRFVVIGFASGEIARVPLNLVLLKGVSVLGFDQRSFAANRPDLRQRDEAELLGLLAAGQLRPRVTAGFPLDRVTEALQMIADRRVSGKAVVHVAPGPGVATRSAKG